MMDKVNWTLPGMEKFDEHDIKWLTRIIVHEQLVKDPSCMGWAYWPTKNFGYLDERYLRKLADFIEIQNKPFWDEYEAYCAEQELKKTPEDWLKEPEYKMYKIMDPDGWRGKDAPSWETPISEEEFAQRLMQCTIMRLL